MVWGYAWDRFRKFLETANTWTGIQTFASLIATTVDINGGHIDDTRIGETTPAVGAFTTATVTIAIDDSDNDTQVVSSAWTRNQIAVVANPKAMSQAVHLVAGAVAAIKNDHSLVYSNTTNSFSIGGEFALPLWTPAANQTLRNKWAANVGYKLEVVLTSGAFALYLNDTVYTSAIPGGGAASNLVAGTKHSILAVPTVGATTTTVSFFLDGVLLSTTAAQANEDVTTTGDMYTGGTSAATFAMDVYNVYDYNRALTAAEVLDLYRNGVAFADQWGSQTSLGVSTIVNNGYSTFSGASATGFHAESDAAGLDFASTVDEIVYVAGKKYRSVFTCSAITGTAPRFGPAKDTAATSLSGTSQGASAVEGLNTYEFTPTESTTGTYVWFNLSTTTNYTISGFSLVEIGATLALPPEGINHYQWLDSSTNELNGLMPATGATLTRPKYDGILKFTTDTTSKFIHYLTSGSATARSIFPIGNAWIESIMAYSAGTPTFSCGEATGATAASLVASTTLVAATWTKLPLLKNSTTNDDIWVEQTAGGAAIKFIIRYSLLTAQA